MEALRTRKAGPLAAPFGGAKTASGENLKRLHAAIGERPGERRPPARDREEEGHHHGRRDQPDGKMSPAVAGYDLEVLYALVGDRDHSPP
jgi:hypothetical protein